MSVHIRKYVTEDKSKTQYKTKSTRGTDPQYFNGGGGWHYCNGVITGRPLKTFQMHEIYTTKFGQSVAKSLILLTSIVQCFTSHQHSIYMRDGFYRLKDPTNSIKVLKVAWAWLQHYISYTADGFTKYSNRLIDWLSMVLRLRQHNIGYTADGFYRSDDPTNSVKALKEGG